MSRRSTSHVRSWVPMVGEEISHVIHRFRWTEPFPVRGSLMYLSLFSPAEKQFLLLQKTNNMYHMFDYGMRVNCQVAFVFFYFTTEQPYPLRADGIAMQLGPENIYWKELDAWLRRVRVIEERISNSVGLVQEIESWCDNRDILTSEIAFLWPTYREFLQRAGDYALTTEPVPKITKEFKDRFDIELLDTHIASALMLPKTGDHENPAAWEEV